MPGRWRVMCVCVGFGWEFSFIIGFDAAFTWRLLCLGWEGTFVVYISFSWGGKVVKNPGMLYRVGKMRMLGLLSADQEKLFFIDRKAVQRESIQPCKAS